MGMTIIKQEPLVEGQGTDITPERINDLEKSYAELKLRTDMLLDMSGLGDSDVQAVLSEEGE